MDNARLKQSRESLDRDIKAIYKVIPKSKFGTLFNEASRVEMTAAQGVRAMHLLHDVWSEVRDQFDFEAEVVGMVEDTLAFLHQYYPAK